jgi:hypothetical protein
MLPHALVLGRSPVRLRDFFEAYPGEMLNTASAVACCGPLVEVRNPPGVARPRGPTNRPVNAFSATGGGTVRESDSDVRRVQIRCKDPRQRGSAQMANRYGNLLRFIGTFCKATLAFSALPATERTASAESAAASATDARRAAELVAAAKAARAAGDAHQALRGFRDAWELTKTPEIAANLAVVEASFGHHRDAAEHFQFALSHLPATATAEQEQAVAAGLDEEKRYVVTLVIQGAPMGARILIDGTLVGVAPGLHHAYVNPGLHVVSAEAPSYQSVTRSIQASAGTTVAVPLALQVERGVQPSTSSAGAVPAASAAEPPRLDDQAGPDLAPILIGAGVTVVGATIGTVFLLKMNSAKTEASNLSGSLPAGDAACGGMTPYASQCEALENANADGNRYRTISAVSFAVAGAAAVGTAVYWLWPRGAHTGAVPRASASFAPGYASAEARWCW